VKKKIIKTEVTPMKIAIGNVKENNCFEANLLFCHVLFRFLRLRISPESTNNAWSHGTSLGTNWCHGIFAVPRKSHPHPKGSEIDCMINVMLTNNIGITNAIHSIRPNGRRLPDEARNTSLTLILIPDNLTAQNDSK
jgi:hypothetical protein